MSGTTTGAKIKKQINVKCGRARCPKIEADGVDLLTCTGCRSISYCSKECQLDDWKNGNHKALCKHFNAGDANQIQHPDHLGRDFQADKENLIRQLPNGSTQLQLLDSFEESQNQTNRKRAVTLRKMNNLFRELSKAAKEEFFMRCLTVLAVAPTEMLELRTSPLKVALQHVNPNVRVKCCGGGHATALHALAEWSDPSNGLVSENQLVLGKQLIARRANVNAKAVNNNQMTPLHMACFSKTVINLGFVELLMDNGADPNAQTSVGETPLMYTLPYAPGATKFLLEYEGNHKVDPNIVAFSTSKNNAGKSLLACVRDSILQLTLMNKSPMQPPKERAKNAYIIQQLQQVETMLVERGAKEIRGDDYEARSAFARMNI